MTIRMKVIRRGATPALSRRTRKWSLCRELRCGGICKFLKQVLPTSEERYWKLNCPYGWITTADGKGGYAVTLVKWIRNQLHVFAIQIHMFSRDIAKLLDSCAVLGRRMNSYVLRGGRGHWGDLGGQKILVPLDDLRWPACIPFFFRQIMRNGAPHETRRTAGLVQTDLKWSRQEFAARYHRPTPS